MRYKLIVPLLFAVAVTACASKPDQYLGPEYYYNKDGVEYSCRNPKPYLGGNCKPESEWPQ